MSTGNSPFQSALQNFKGELHWVKRCRRSDFVSIAYGLTFIASKLNLEVWCFRLLGIRVRSRRDLIPVAHVKYCFEERIILTKQSGCHLKGRLKAVPDLIIPLLRVSTYNQPNFAVYDKNLPPLPYQGIFRQGEKIRYGRLQRQKEIGSISLERISYNE